MQKQGPTATAALDLRPLTLKPSIPVQEDADASVTRLHSRDMGAHATGSGNGASVASSSRPLP